ncbi:MAG TPA: PilZ domain-containing protein [Pirellulales bacterium]|nr:PilZ domain-containing protein [Pirellulales bacterium]
MRQLSPLGRRPRHSAATAEIVTCELRRAAGELPRVVAAELLDLSRQGTRLRTEAVLAPNEVLSICLRSDEPALDLNLTGVVRWRQQEATGRWLHGCEFKGELSLETLGELFLCGVLSTRPPASSG